MHLLPLLLSGLILSSPLSLTVASTALAQAEQQEQAPLRVVILPFENLSQNPADDWLSQSFAESLTMGLLPVHALQVIERNQIKEVLREQHFGQNERVDAESAPKLGKLLGAKVVIIGSYQKVGDQLQANVRFVDAETGRIDTERYARIQGSFDQIFDLQDELAHKLIQNLNVQAQPQELQKMQTVLKATHSPEAYRFYQQGVQLLRDGGYAQMDEARQAFEQARKADPNYALAYAGLAEIHARRAQRTFKILVLPGQKDQYQNDAELARQYANKALTLNPDLPEVLRALAWLDWESGKKEAAMAKLTHAIHLNPRDADSLLAYLQFRMDKDGFKLDYSQLSQELQALGADPQNPWLQFTLAAVSMPQAIQNGQDLKLQADLLEQAKQKLPHNPKITLILSSILTYQGKKEAALVEMQKTEDLSQDFPEMLATVASMRSQLFGQHEKALKICDQAIAQAPQLITSQQTRAEILYRLHRNQEAEALYTHLEQESPDNLMLMISHSTSLMLSGQPEKSKEILERAMQLKDAPMAQELKPALQFSLGNTYAVLNEYAKARPLLEAVLNDPLFAMGGYLALTRIYDAQQDYAALLKATSALMALSPPMRQNPFVQNHYRKAYLELALQKDPNNAALLNDLGQVLLLLHDYPAAQIQLKKALQLDPDNPVINGNLGYFYYSTQDFSMAQTYLERAVTLKPDYVKAWYNLGLTYRQAGQNAKARSAFEKVLQLDPQHEQAQAELKQLKP